MQAKVSECKVKKPKTYYYHLQEYLDQFGDPDKKGHKRVKCMGEECVAVPGKRRVVVEQNVSDRIEHQETKDDGSFMLSDDQLGNMFEGMTSTLFAAFPSASGASLDELLSANTGHTVSQPASSSRTTPAQPNVSDDEDDNLLRSSGSLATSAACISSTPSQPEAPSPNPKGRQKLSRAGSAGSVSTPPSKKAKHAKAAKESPNSGPNASASMSMSPGADKKRGRPKVCSLGKCKKDLQDFSECEQGSKFFAASNNFRRAMEYSLRILKSEIASKVVYGEDEEVHITNTSTSACISISRVAET